uniref:Uncharacterized protein n=1 Tax=Glossina austeni TaxID=7395 RepID=A0A1A9URS3_GLOAU
MMSDIKIELGNGECDEIANCNAINQTESSEKNKAKAVDTRLPSNDKNEKNSKAPIKGGSIPKSKRKRPLLNQYHKHMVLEHMINCGCDVENLLSAIRNFKVPKEELLRQLNSSVKEAEDYVYQECDSLSFQNITVWLEYLKKIKAPEHCHYELGVVLNAIANNESYPNPAEINGIDLKAIYTFLSNSLFGLPQPRLDSASSAFLIDEFENLINEANTEGGDRDTCELREQLQSRLSAANPDDRPSSLNPFKLYSKIGKI